MNITSKILKINTEKTMSLIEGIILSFYTQNPN